MENKRLDDIYQSFINSPEYNNKFLSLEYDLSFLDKRITTQEIRRLEVLILSYASAHEKAIFECGFCYAWDLFHECQKHINSDT